MYRDVRDLPMTASSQSAVDAFDACVLEYLGSGRDVSRLLQSIAQVDGDMPMGRCLQGYLFMLTSLEAYQPRARAALAAAEAVADTANAREKLHIAALGRWCAGDLTGALAAWNRILEEWPRDVLAFRLGHFLHFFIGDIKGMREAAERTVPRWDEGVPAYGYVLGCRAFAREETGDYAAAEMMARRAVEIEPSDVWSGHAMAHTLEMTGRTREGIDWVTAYEEVWRRRGTFANHLWWHRTLYQFELERFDEVLESFDRLIWREPTEDNLDICNGTSLLMRLEMHGVPVGERWQTLAEVCAGRLGMRLRPFNDLHFVMGLAMGGRRAETAALVERMRGFAREHEDKPVTLGPIMRDLGVPVAEAIEAYAAGDYERTVERMLTVHESMLPLGGSWAQRDVWVQMLIVAALRSGRFDLARSLLDRRVAAKGTSAPSWRLHAQAMQGLGDLDAAALSRARADALVA